MSNRRYVLISPCRDEAEHAPHARKCHGTERPVDDGSTDDTPAILESYRPRMPYLRVVRRANRGRGSVAVIEAFYAGLETVTLEDFDYVCKLDLDLPRRYFELLLIMARMDANPRLGTTSGKPYFIAPGNRNLVAEVCGGEIRV